MNQESAVAGAAAWGRLTESLREHSLAFREFLGEGIDRVPLVRKGLRSGGAERAAALRVIPYLDLAERMGLFSDLVWLASFAHGSIGLVRQMLLGLPHEYLMSSIELEAEPLLQSGTYDEYRRFLELYELFDVNLTLRLARRAAASNDPDIREAGEDFLQRLAGPQVNGAVVDAPTAP